MTGQPVKQIAKIDVEHIVFEIAHIAAFNHDVFMHFVIAGILNFFGI